ncbi:uncharacterized protein LOC113140732 [Mastacembelus armatus]|uniref:uncharacterized protein LOC113140732 n=1 Tax=Mastacembelus armatus TaxID=205130 RepID=UPI000E458DAC|nr:uncharacterized protein LOC113140732 [Mastacembelus armatus]
MVIPEGFKHTWSPGQLCMFGLVSVVLMGLTSPQTVGDQTGTDPTSSPTTVNNTTNVTESSTITDWEERIIGCYIIRFNPLPVMIIAGIVLLVFVLVLVLIINCYRKNCAKRTIKDGKTDPIIGGSAGVFVFFVFATFTVTVVATISGVVALFVAGVLVFVLVLLIIICCRKKCAKQAQRPDQENAIEGVPLDSPTPRDNTPEDCPTGKLTKDCDGVSVEVCGVAARPRVNHG